jgi:WD repeat-containing protein 35
LYQVSDKGRETLKQITRTDKEAVNDFAHKPDSRELLRTLWDGESFWLESSSGYRKRSTTTDTEDVSYVSSAYIPQCLRYGGRPTLSNAHRAKESGQAGLDNIRDNDLEEIITLNSVSMIVAEYIPFGANQIVQLNNNVGSTERVQGGYISNVIDGDSSGTAMELSPELTSVEILDYTQTNHINFEAEIRFREDPGVVQVETFGVSLNAEGTCFYGMQVEAVMNRIKDNISLDHLSRILVDVQQDSSSIVDSVISQYQRDLLELVFIGDAPNRNKINLIIANEITPHLTAGEYMDKGEYENEFKQVIGDTKAAYDITEQDSLIFGSQGLLVCGPHARNYEPLLCAYLQFTTLDLFLQNFFSRIWILNDDLKASDNIVAAVEYDPSALGKSRHRLSTLSNEIILLDQILSYLNEALEIMEIPPEPPEQAGRSLYQRLEISGMRDQLVRRVNDVKKNLTASQRNLDLLRERVEVESQNKSFQMSLELEKNTKQLCALQVSNGDALRSLRVLQTIFAGMIAFDFLDRVTGEWNVVDGGWMSEFFDTVIKENILLWFAVSMAAWALAALFISKRTFLLNWRSRGTTKLNISMNRKIDTAKLRDLIGEKEKTTEERRYEGKRQIVKVVYNEPPSNDWGGATPSVTLEYDDNNSILLEMVIDYNRRDARKDSVLSADELKQKMMHEYDNKSIFVGADQSLRDYDLAIDKRRSILKTDMKSVKFKEL